MQVAANQPLEWDSEFLDELDARPKEEDFWSNMEDAWSSLRKETSSHPWLNEYEKDQEYK